MDTNYPVEIVIGLLVLLGLVYLAHHQQPRLPRIQQAMEHVVPVVVSAPGGNGGK